MTQQSGSHGHIRRYNTAIMDTLERVDAPTAESRLRKFIDRYKSGCYPDLYDAGIRVDAANIAVFCLLYQIEESDLIVDALKICISQDNFLKYVCLIPYYLPKTALGDKTVLEYFMGHAVKANWDLFEILSRNAWSSNYWSKSKIFLMYCDMEPTQIAALLRHGYVVSTCKEDISPEEKWPYLYRKNTEFIEELLLKFSWLLNPPERRSKDKTSERTIGVQLNADPPERHSEDKDSESEDEDIADSLFPLRESLQLFIRSIPFPLPQDMYLILLILFPDTIFHLDTPRTLKHLCRCRIRDCLFQNWMLPEGIRQLEVPSYIQSYLNLEC